MAREIRCQGKASNGATCGRFLAEVDGCNLLILCPVCRKKHAIPLTDLLADLEAWLTEVRTKQGSGQGFML